MKPGAKNGVQNVDSPQPLLSASPEPFEDSFSPEPSDPPMPYPRQRSMTFQKDPKPNFGEGRSATRPSRAIYRQSILRGFTTIRAAQLVH